MDSIQWSTESYSTTTHSPRTRDSTSSGFVIVPYECTESSVELVVWVDMPKEVIEPEKVRSRPEPEKAVGRIPRKDRRIVSPSGGWFFHRS
jgi:hypothetical protein